MNETYWNKVGGGSLSDQFKNLMIHMFQYTPSNRLTINEIRNHPWMQNKFDINKVRSRLLN